MSRGEVEARLPVMVKSSLAARVVFLCLSAEGSKPRGGYPLCASPPETRAKLPCSSSALVPPLPHTGAAVRFQAAQASLACGLRSDETTR